ncbi:MAG: hypothetical protein OXS33_05125 [bacterium]|nr:hypothetical protein [bacterium]
MSYSSRHLRLREGIRTSNISRTVLYASAALALILASCGHDTESSGIATLVEETPPAEARPMSEDTQTADVPTMPEGTVEENTETTIGTTEGMGEDAGADLPPEERLLSFADCMRENGVNFPDPVVEPDGSVTFGFAPGTGDMGDMEEPPDLQTAGAACMGLLQGVTFETGSGSFDTTALEDSLLEFARCMRDRGVDMGDPDFSVPGGSGSIIVWDLSGDGSADGGGKGSGAGPFGEGIDLGDPDVMAAFEVCQDAINTGQTGGGG